MVHDRKLANAVGGKSARPCDNCVRKRASWYCAADDAFLCQSCDSSVHTANPLARRHERVRLKTTATNDESSKEKLQISVPSWHQGFTRKARTPRMKKNDSFFGKRLDFVHDLVPEMCSEEQENEEQLLYRVPIIDPSEVAVDTVQNDAILPSELDLAEFAADIESFLGKGLEDDSFDMEGLGILDCDDQSGKESKECSLKIIKFEESYQIDMGRETFELNFDYTSPITYEEEEGEENKAENQEPIFMNNCKVDGSSKSFLKLDYKGVISAWDDQKSPWTTGERPELNPGDNWPDCLGRSGSMHAYGEMGRTSGGAAAMGDGGREARVSRYREKRRTRLFSKKIRYEVRKLNAEKRPRMKGRFVKRANFAASAFPLLNN